MLKSSARPAKNHISGRPALKDAFSGRRPSAMVAGAICAMDCPHRYAVDEANALGAFDILDADKHAFFEGNARRVFRLG